MTFEEYIIIRNQCDYKTAKGGIIRVDIALNRA